MTKIFIVVNVLFTLSIPNNAYIILVFSKKSYTIKVKILILQSYCPGGGIGRHASLRGWRSKGHASSSLVLGTFLNLL